MEPEPSRELISQGAEARVYKCTFLGHAAVMKERFPKTYRHPTLDAKITSRRLAQEARSILRAHRASVPTPILFFVDTVTNRLYMEFIPGITVKVFLWRNPPPAAQEHAVKLMGQVISQMHAHDIIHGDLTTSNFMLRADEFNRVVVIDFGLSTQSNLAEDKAVDLYVLERAFLSSHPNSTHLFTALLKAYEGAEPNPKVKQVLSKLEEGAGASPFIYSSPRLVRRLTRALAQ